MTKLLEDLEKYCIAVKSGYIINKHKQVVPLFTFDPGFPLNTIECAINLSAYIQDKQAEYIDGLHASCFNRARKHHGKCKTCLAQEYYRRTKCQ